MKDAQFRAGGYGRFEWTVDGEDYFKQYLPPSVTDMSYSPESLVAEMDYAEVDMALLHRTPYLGVGNDFYADCVRRFPDRLLGLAHVEEWLVERDPDTAVAKVRRAIEQLGLHGLQFIPAQLYRAGQGGQWEGPAFRPFWDGVTELKVPVFLSIFERRDPKLESYLAELNALQRWMDRYPDVNVVITHGFSWRMFVDGDRIRLPKEVWAPFDNPRLHLKLLFPISLGDIWDYPMAEVRPTIEECVQRIGARRLIWGSDMPVVMRFWTYRQNLEYIRSYCHFLSPQELEQIMGGNVARVMGVGFP